MAVDSPGHEWLCAVWYPWEIDSAQYDTPGRFLRKFWINKRNLDQWKYFNPLLSGPGWLELWKEQVKNLVGLSLSIGSRKVIWLTGVWYPGEIDSAQYHTPGRFIKIRITRRKLNQNRKYFNPLVSGPGWFKWWKQIDVKNLGGLSLFKVILHFCQYCTQVGLAWRRTEPCWLLQLGSDFYQGRLD